MIRTATLFLLLLLSLGAAAQDPYLDSLTTLAEGDSHDTMKVRALNVLFLEFEFSEPEKAAKYIGQAVEISKRSGYRKGLARSCKHSGYLAEDKGNYPEALKNYFNSLKVYQELNDKKGTADIFNGIGSVYFFQKNYQPALKNYNEALRLYREVGYKRGVAASYNNLGNVHSELNEFGEALKNMYASLKIEEEIGNRKGIAYSYNNIGNLNEKQADILYAEGKPYKEKLEEALKNHLEGLRIKLEEGEKDNAGIASSYGNIGRVYLGKKDYKESRAYLNKAKDLALSIGYRSCLKNTYQSLSMLDSVEGNFRSAFEHHRLYIAYRDSLDNEESRKKTIQSQLNYDFEKKEAIAEAEHRKELEKQMLLDEEKSSKQQLILVLAAASFVLVLAFAIFFWRSLRITRQQKSMIEQQKEVVMEQKKQVEKQKALVEEKQKEIIDSINYAKKI